MEERADSVSAVLARYGFAASGQTVAAALGEALAVGGAHPWAVGVANARTGVFTVHHRCPDRQQAQELAQVVSTDLAGVGVRLLPQLTAGELSRVFGEFGATLDSWRMPRERRPQ